jgi:hypothetical protein
MTAPAKPRMTSERWRRSVLDGVAAVKGNARWLSELTELPAKITDAEREQIIKDMRAAQAAIRRFLTARGAR